METQAYTSSWDGEELTSGREVAKNAIKKAIERRRAAQADHANARLSMEFAGHEEVDGKMASARRVWARQDKEEFLIYELGGAEDEVRVEAQREEHANELPDQTKFGLI